MISSGEISVTIGMLPEMNTTEPYSPMARANDSAKPVSQAGKEIRQDDPRDHVDAVGPEARRRLLDLRIEVLDDRLQRPDHERQPDEDERDGDAERRVGDLDPVSVQRLVPASHSGHRSPSA